jgi:hypothetical protein
MDRRKTTQPYTIGFKVRKKMFDREGKFEKPKDPKTLKKAQKTKEGLVKYYEKQYKLL